MDWFRWHQGSVTDPKFQLVARRSGRSVAEVIALWAVVLEAANASEARGLHGNLDFESIDCQLGLPDGAAVDIYTSLCGRGLVDGELGLVMAWDKRQPRREREADESSTSRVRRHRAKVTPVGDSATHTDGIGADIDQSNPSLLHGVALNETPCNATKHQKQPRGEEKRREESNTSFSEKRVGASSPPDASPSAPPTASFSEFWGKDPSRQGAVLPADWVLPLPWREFCANERPDLDVDAVAVRFADHWRSVAGAKARKADWPATWRNWVRSERQIASVARSFDVSRTTTPGPKDIDPELKKIEADDKRAAPPPAYIRQQVAKHKNAGV